MKMSSEEGTEETAASPTSGRSRRLPGERETERVRKQDKQEPEIDKSAVDSEIEKGGEVRKGREREQTVTPLGRAYAAEEEGRMRKERD